MPQMRSLLALTALCLGGALLLSGCGDENPQSVYTPRSGEHPANWLPQGHSAAARNNLDSCVDCHGENFDGGISRVACTTCHPVSPFSVHPLQWEEFAYARHASFVAQNGVATCSAAACHGADLAGAGEAPGCATACHLGGAAAAHPADWSVAGGGGALATASLHGEFVTAGGGYDAGSCSNLACHGPALQGVFVSGPSCYGCHPADPTDPNPRPSTHPSNRSAQWMADEDLPGFHANYLKNVLRFNTSSCSTNICHGTGGTGPSCSTPTFNGRSCH